MATIRIKDLRLRAIIGIHDWEREHKQDIIINIMFTYNADKASASDNMKEAVDYKSITKDIIKEVESSQYFLLEKLADKILTIVLKDSRVSEATVRADKPLALRFADSVSVEISRKQRS